MSQLSGKGVHFPPSFSAQERTHEYVTLYDGLRSEVEKLPGTYWKGIALVTLEQSLIATAKALRYDGYPDEGLQVQPPTPTPEDQLEQHEETDTPAPKPESEEIHGD